MHPHTHALRSAYEDAAACEADHAGVARHCRRHPALAALGLLAPVTLVLASCSNGSSNPATAPSSTSSTSIAPATTAAPSTTSATTVTTTTAVTGESWSTPEVVAPGEVLTSVSCPTTEFCGAAGYKEGRKIGESYVSIWSGGRWGPPLALYAGQTYDIPHEGIACPAPGTCIAVTETGYASWLRAGTWSRPELIDPLASGYAGYEMMGVSCASALLAGSRWTAGPAAPSRGLPTDISCTSPTFCMEVGGSHADGDVAARFDGSAWSALPAPPDAGAAVGFAKVSCANPTFCAAIDGGAGNNGAPSTDRAPDVFFWNGEAWSAPMPVDKSGDPDAVSCPSPSFCVAVDVRGDAIFYG
jgi:hypothetical protein